MRANEKLSIKNVNIVFFSAIAILCLMLIVCTTAVVIKFNKYASNSDKCYEVSKATIKIQEGSDYLTDESRFFILSGELNHLNNYFYERNIAKRRENAIQELSILYPDQETLNILKTVLWESKELENLEIYAMRLVADGHHYDRNPGITLPSEITEVIIKPEDLILSDEYKIAKAWLLLFSEEYMTKKHSISELNGNAISAIIGTTEKSHFVSYEELKDIFFRMIVIIALIFAITFFLFIIIRIFVLKPLYKNIDNISKGKQLTIANTKEFDILTSTFNKMYEKNEAKEILLKHKAEHDELTGILNRAAFNQIKSAYMNSSEKLALIIIDIDFFKNVNDNHGHSTGDLVLQKVARVLKDSFRNSDFVARIGGDEFAIILTKCDSNIEVTKNLISSKMEQIKEMLLNTDDGLPLITLSCGIGFSSQGYTNELYEHADAALYEVKESGRNNFKFY